MRTSRLHAPTLAGLCRGNPAEFASFLLTRESLGLSAARIAGFGAIYGATMGIWRGPDLALFVAIKFPLLLLLTALGTALANGLMAQALGLDLPVSRSLALVLHGYSLLALILASLSPLILFLDANLAGPEEPGRWSAHNVLALAHIAAIGFAGTVAHWKLHHVLAYWTGRTATGILCVWLATNLFLGCQLSWNLRPFFGSPTIEVRFLRAQPWRGNFYESTWTMFRQLTRSDDKETSDE